MKTRDAYFPCINTEQYQNPPFPLNGAGGVCHKCGWKGNAITLAKELGVYRRLSSDQNRQMREKRERVHEGAQRLYGAIQSRREGLLDRLHDLSRLEIAAHKIGPTEAAWKALEMVYNKRPGVLAELDILENSTAADLVRYLSEKVDVCQRVVSAVLNDDGVFDLDARFIEITA